MPEQTADTVLNRMLEAGNLKAKASYNRAEVCRLLGISPRTFWSMVFTFEPGSGMQPKHTATLDSFMLRGQRRVPYHELEAFLRRNRTYERIHADDPRQMCIPGF